MAPKNTQAHVMLMKLAHGLLFERQAFIAMFLSNGTLDVLGWIIFIIIVIVRTPNEIYRFDKFLSVQGGIVDCRHNVAQKSSRTHSRSA